MSDDQPREGQEPEADDAGGPGDPGAPEGAGREEEEPERDEGGELSTEIREALEELEELRDRHLRLAAEFENYRKRTRAELKEAKDRGQAALAERLLDALDDLDRMLKTSDEGLTLESLREGVEMAYRKLERELSEAGLEKMNPEGEAFDPEYHEALLTTPVEEPEEDRTVARVLINGYRFGDRVLRPARVEVKKYEEPEGSGEGEGSDDADEPDDEPDEG